MTNELSFVLASRKRRAVLDRVKTGRTPTQLSKLLEMSQPNVSLKLRALERRGLVKCLTPNFRKGRIYHITETGSKVLKEIERMESG